MLVQYCRLIIRARRLAQLIEAAESAVHFDAVEYRELVRAEENVSRATMSLATKMRISQQAAVRVDLARKPQHWCARHGTNDGCVTSFRSRRPREEIEG